MVAYYQQTVEETLREFESKVAGLESDKVEKLQARYGFNELPQKEFSLYKLFFRQFQDVFVYILIGAMVLSLILPFLEQGSPDFENFLDAMVIFAILLINALLGFVQEYKAEKSIDSLQKMTAGMARVRREGREKVMPARELVPGDVVVLSSGDRVPADGRLIALSNLKIDESGLTGESLPVKKALHRIEKAIALADRYNMAFGGTLITDGDGEMVKVVPFV